VVIAESLVAHKTSSWAVNIDKLVIDAKRLSKPIADRLHAESLRSVVTGRDECYVALTRHMNSLLRHFARDEQVNARVGRVINIALPATRAPSYRGDRLAVIPNRHNGSIKATR
jgi:hypothetical protein